DDEMWKCRELKLRTDLPFDQMVCSGWQRPLAGNMPRVPDGVEGIDGLKDRERLQVNRNRHQTCLDSRTCARHMPSEAVCQQGASSDEQNVPTVGIGGCGQEVTIFMTNACWSMS